MRTSCSYRSSPAIRVIHCATVSTSCLRVEAPTTLLSRPSGDHTHAIAERLRGRCLSAMAAGGELSVMGSKRFGSRSRPANVYGWPAALHCSAPVAASNLCTPASESAISTE